MFRTLQQTTQNTAPVQGKQGSFFQPKLSINQPNDVYEQEADAVAEQVVQQKNASAQFFKPLQKHTNSIQRDEPKTGTQAQTEEPDPIGGGLETVAENLFENNPAFSRIMDQLKDTILSQPADAIGAEIFLLGSSYAMFLGSTFTDRAMRRQVSGFNLALLPGLIPQFPLKTFQYDVLNEEQTQYKFEVELDFAGLLESATDSKFFSGLGIGAKGDLDTEDSDVGLSALNVNLGFLNDSIIYSAGYANELQPYPVLVPRAQPDEPAWIMQQIPGMGPIPTDYPDIRFMLKLDVYKLYNYLNPDKPPILPYIKPEIEGDTVLKKEITNSDHKISRMCSACKNEDEALHRKEKNNTKTEASNELENYIGGLENSGNNLSHGANQFFSQKIGYDFSDVKIHTDAIAAKSAQSINALAYTTGNHIVFNQNQYQPETASGKRLLAHELTHVVQQNGNISAKKIQRQQEFPEGTYYKSLPQLEPQETAWSCWAAALRSWILATPGRNTSNTQSDLITLYKSQANGGIDPKDKIPEISSDYNIDYDVIEGKRFRASKIAKHLKERGHVIIMYNVSKGVAHSHVVYGVGYPDGVNYMISVMNPSGSGSYENHLPSYYSSKPFLIIAYPK